MRTLLFTCTAIAALLCSAVTAAQSGQQEDARAARSEPAVKSNITNVQDLSQLMKDPEYREAKRAEIHSGYAKSAGDVANGLGLTTSQLSQLVDLETERQMGILDSLAPALRPGTRPDPAAGRASAAKQQEVRSKFDADIVALLGAGKAQEFGDYEKSKPIVNQLQASLKVAGYPMTVEQWKSLIGTIAAEEGRHNSELADFEAQLRDGAIAYQTAYEMLSAKVEIDVQENARIVQAATPVLSPPQLSSLQKMLADNIARHRLHLQAHIVEYSTSK